MKLFGTGVLLRIALWLFALVVLVAATVLMLHGGEWIFGAIGFVCVVIVVVQIINLVKSYAHKAAFMFNAIENHDFTFRFAQNIGSKDERYFNASLNRIKELITATEKQIAERERYYESIINRASIGILVFDPQSAIVYKTNTRANELLGLSAISHIKQLEKLGADIPQRLMQATEKWSSKISFFNEATQITLSVTCSKIPLRGREMTVVALSDIRQQLDETMNESWMRFSRVLTHEIMNSLTPIISLSEELRKTTDREVVDRGLEIISTTGCGLVGFVENYRRLTRLPPPVLSRFDLSQLILRTAHLMEREIDTTQLNHKLEVVADQEMITQVVTNLMRNAIEATGSDNRIFVSTSFDTLGRATAEFGNEGPPIDPQTAENIFIPFFTTKKGGSGIGLSLARQIMHLNSGTISHTTRNIDGVSTTIFTIQFYQ